MRLRFAGFGGQGVVLCGFIFGKAAMLDGKNAIHTQSYGSASRGGLTRSDVSISSETIYDLIHDELDLLVTMSQQSYDRFHGDLMPDGWLFFESDLVQLAGPCEPRWFGFPATDIAYKRFGRKIIANMVMIGFVNQVAGVVSQDALVKTIRESVPPGTEDLNINALEEGGRMAKGELASRQELVAGPAGSARNGA
jgi:2-oxoglutarate ferredoxin oxidoreductase subunit gamma